MKLKNIVTLHRQSEQTTSERQKKEIEIKHFSINNLKIKERKKDYGKDSSFNDH